MPPAARVTDMHTCPMFTGPVPHVGGPILPPGVPTVLIGFLPAATVTDMLTCVGPPDMIVMGSVGVFINFLPAARLGDPTVHGGVIIVGEPTVMIGEVGAPSPGTAGASAVTAGVAASTPQAPSQAKGKPPGKPVTPPCSAETIKKRFDACDGGTHLWADAKQSLGKDPKVQIGPVAGGFEANTDIVNGVITIAPTTDCCSATASLFFELTNAKSKSRHLAVDDAAAKGEIAREDYAKKEARIEYDGVILLRDTFAKCREKWGCSATATSGYESVSNDFDTYYAGQRQDYKDYYRNAWDGSYKAAYAAKHPATGAKGGH